MRKPAGSMLGAVLMVVAIAVLGGFLLATAGTFHLSLVQTLTQRETARLHAEQVLALAIAQLQQDQTFHQTLDWSQGDEGWKLTFAAGSTDVPTSLNNLTSSTSTSGSTNVPVPANAAFLVARGWAGHEVATVQELVALPAWPFVIACGGPIATHGPVLVARSKTVPALPVRADDTVPGDIASNATGPQAIVLDAQAAITGDVRAAGGIQLGGSPVSVGGQVLPYDGTIQIPALDITQFDPAVIAHVQTPTPTSSMQVQGFARYPGTMTVPGDLVVQQGVLYVDGNLTVQGGLRGQGAVFVHGSATVSGDTSLRSDDQVALLASGDVTMAGSDTVFQGMVYAGGTFSASHVTVLGSFVAQGGMDLTSSSLVYVPSLARLEMPISGSIVNATRYAVPNQSPTPYYGVDIYPPTQAGIYRASGTPLRPDVDKTILGDYEIFILGAPGPSGKPCELINPIVSETGAYSGVATLPYYSMAALTRDILQETQIRPGPQSGIGLTMPPPLPQANPLTSIQNVCDSYTQALRQWLYRPSGTPYREPDVLQTMLSTQALVGSGVQPVTPGATWRLDWNDFLSPADRMRVLLWQSL
ncbi:MAG: hypothetical protein ACYCW6_05015 [Candidatus Xenobia bacterium]